MEQLSEALDSVRADGRLGEVHGIGKAIADKLNEYGDTGKLGYLDKLEAEVPPGLLDFLRIPGLGPRTAKDIYDTLGVTTLEGLEAALQDGTIAKVPRIRGKTQDNITKGLEALRGRGSGPRALLPKAMATADAFVSALEQLPGVQKVSTAGSLRRRRDSIGDIDIVVAARDAAPVMEAFCGLAYVDDVLARGETKSSVRTQDGHPGRPPRCAAGALRRGAGVLHRQQGAQRPHAGAGAEAGPDAERIRPRDPRAGGRRGRGGGGRGGGRGGPG